MTSVFRQPFAPLDGSRLQSLTSLKNRQNAVTPSKAAGKRKAELLDTDDSENVDPLLFAKRNKGSNSATLSKDFLKKPSSFVLTRATGVTTSASTKALSSPIKATSTPRRTLQPKSPAAKLNTNITKSSPISAPAGRSPTRGKRPGILTNRRLTAGPYTRVNPPAFSPDCSAPFSLDAALKGTIPSYEARPRSAALTKARGSSVLTEPDMKAGWFFDIHEDTPEQEMTNLLQHSTCVLDISSDEESEQKACRENEDGRDKENVPPVDDVSQTSARRARIVAADDMIIEKERVALGEMNTADFYAHGCDETTVIIIPGDDEELPEPVNDKPTVDDEKLAPQSTNIDALKSIDELMCKTVSSSKAAVLQQMEGTGEQFDLWESGSAKDDGEAVTAES